MTDNKTEYAGLGLGLGLACRISNSGKIQHGTIKGGSTFRRQDGALLSSKHRGARAKGQKFNGIESRLVV